MTETLLKSVLTVVYAWWNSKDEVNYITLENINCLLLIYRVHNNILLQLLSRTICVMRLSSGAILY